MPRLAEPGFLAAASETFSELAPFLVVMVTGFLLGAWGQASRAPIAILAGMLLIIAAIAGFMIENSSGPTPEVAR